MTPDEARELLAYRDLQLSFVPNLPAEQQDARAAILASRLPNTPLAWALDFVIEESVRGRVPTDAQIIAGWRAHQDRVDPDVVHHIRVAIPDAPRALDPGLWPAWNRARAAALRGGASPDEALDAANRALGVEPDPPTHGDVEAAKRKLREALARLRARQEQLDADIDAEPLTERAAS